MTGHCQPLHASQLLHIQMPPKEEERTRGGRGRSVHTVDPDDVAQTPAAGRSAGTLSAGFVRQNEDSDCSFSSSSPQSPEGGINIEVTGGLEGSR